MQHATEQAKPGAAKPTRHGFRRIQSMAGPVPGDARALAPALVQARGCHPAPTRDEAFQRQLRTTPWLDFGQVFLAFAVAGRQGLLKLVDDFCLESGLGPRDAVRALMLLFATRRYAQAGEAGEWLARSAAQLLCPASGLAGEEAGMRGDPLPGGLAEKILEACGRPGLLARFLKQFKALADALFRSGGEIAFVDSKAWDIENARPGMAELDRDDRGPRWLYAVRRDTGLPLGLVPIRAIWERGDGEEGERQEDDASNARQDGQEEAEAPAEAPDAALDAALGEAEGGGWPRRGKGGGDGGGDDDDDDWFRRRRAGSAYDTGDLKASFGTFAKAGLRARPACSARGGWTIPALPPATTAEAG